MHLRSGRRLESGSQASTRIYSQGSGTQLPRLLGSIKEEIVPNSSSDSLSSMASGSSHHMDNLIDLDKPTSPAMTSANPMSFDTKLVFIRENAVGAKLYWDPTNRLVIKIEHVMSPFEPEVWASYQYHQYMSQSGTTYVITSHFEWTNMTGRILKPDARATTEPIIFDKEREG